MSDRVLCGSTRVLCVYLRFCGVVCVAPWTVRACALYICGVVCMSPCARYICGVLNCHTKIAIYQDLFTYVIDVLYGFR